MLGRTSLKFLVSFLCFSFLMPSFCQRVELRISTSLGVGDSVGYFFPFLHPKQQEEPFREPVVSKKKEAMCTGTKIAGSVFLHVKESHRRLLLAFQN